MGARGTAGARHLAFEGGDVGTVDRESARCIIVGHGAVKDEVVPKDGSKFLFVGAPNQAIKFTGKVGLLNLAL